MAISYAVENEETEAYDYETGLYYLNSRYYDPVVGRFINADGQMAGIGESVHGYNMFSYCFNNPINMSDENGNWPKWIKTIANWVKERIVKPIKQHLVNKGSKSLETVAKLAADIVNYNKDNGDEDKVFAVEGEWP